jgi:hypothetical protein
MQEQFDNVADISNNATAGFDFIRFFHPVDSRSSTDRPLTLSG